MNETACQTVKWNVKGSTGALFGMLLQRLPSQLLFCAKPTVQDYSMQVNHPRGFIRDTTLQHARLVNKDHVLRP